MIDFDVLLPPGWARLPLNEASYAGARARVAQAAASWPAEVRARLEAETGALLERSLRRAADEGGARELIIPTEPLEGVPLPITISVAEPGGRLALPGTPGEALLAFAARVDDAEAKSVGPCLAVRTAAEQAAQLAEGGELVAPAARRISYLIATPGGFVLVVATILRTGGEFEGELVDALETFFDGMVSTMRFRESKEAEA